MNSQELRNLQEAYMEVYASPEQKGEFELWVDSLLEEGYNLSDYTWDEMYEFYLDESSRRDEFTRAAIARNAGSRGGVTYEPGPDWDQSANRGQGAYLSRKQKEKKRRKALRQEEYVNESSRRDEFTRAAIARNAGSRGGVTYEPGPDWDQSANRGQGAYLSRKQKEKKRRKELARRERNEQVDIYDIILSHLLDEGYAETPEAAEVIMVNMSEEWVESIVEEVLDEGRRTSLSALSRESQERKADKERGRPETEDERHRRLRLGRYSPSQYNYEKDKDGNWRNMGRKDGEKD